MVNPEFIYIVDYLPDGIKYAVGRAGERARQVVQYRYTSMNTVGGSKGGYSGVPGRRPIIPEAARKVSRRAAGAALCKAFGMERW